MQRKTCYILLCLAVLAAVGCKKNNEESTTVKPSLYGIDFKLAPFGAIGETFVLSPVGTVISYSTGESVKESEVDYYWMVDSGKRDTIKQYTFKPEELGDYTVSLTVFSKTGEYYSSTTSHVISIIDPALGKSLTGTGIEAEDDHITSDGVDYYYTNISGTDWFRNNLASPSSGLCYHDSAVTAVPLGRYYTWDEAMTACPAGWTLPTLSQWEALFAEANGEIGELISDAWFNGNRMWEFYPVLKTPQNLGFAALSSGYIQLLGSDRKYQGLYSYAGFWTATESTEEPNAAIFVYLNGNQRSVFQHYADKKSMALSVRCVR